jgi:hypothetical protein
MNHEIGDNDNFAILVLYLGKTFLILEQITAFTKANINYTNRFYLRNKVKKSGKEF